MADQVNPLGGLAPGMAQTLQPLAVPPQPKPAPARSADSKPKADSKAQAAEDRGIGVSREGLEEAAKMVERYLQQATSDLKFLVDKETGMYYFKIIDPVTKETIRQVPAEEIIEMAKRLRALSDPKDAPGVIMDAEG